MTAIKKIILYPLIFAIHPILFIYSENVYEVEINQIFIPLFISVLSAGIIFFILNLIYRDLYKAAVSASILIVFFYSSGHFSNLFENNSFFKENISTVFLSTIYLFYLCMIFQGKKMLKILFIFVTIVFSIYLLINFPQFKSFLAKDIIMSCAILWVILMLLSIYEISILKTNLKKITLPLNLSSLILILFPLFKIIKTLVT